MPTLTVTTRPAADIAADVLVIGARQGSEHAELLDEPHLEPSAAAQLTQALVALEATGKAGEVTRVVGVSGIKAGTVAVVGLGTQVTAETVRAGAATALRAVGSKAKVALALPTPDRATVAAMADGAYAGCYRYAKITGAAAAPATANPDGPTITLVSTQGAGKGVKDAVARASVPDGFQRWRGKSMRRSTHGFPPRRREYWALTSQQILAPGRARRNRAATGRAWTMSPNELGLMIRMLRIMAARPFSRPRPGTAASTASGSAVSCVPAFSTSPGARLAASGRGRTSGNARGRVR